MWVWGCFISRMFYQGGTSLITQQLCCLRGNLLWCKIWKIARIIRKFQESSKIPDFGGNKIGKVKITAILELLPGCASKHWQDRQKYVRVPRAYGTMVGLDDPYIALVILEAVCMCQTACMDRREQKGLVFAFCFCCNKYRSQT